MRNYKRVFGISLDSDLNVDFAKMIRQKYIISNILEEFCGKDTELQLKWEHEGKVM